MRQRERAKQQRRDRILDAAEQLIRAAGDVSFPMRGLADRAGVAPATPFNLFGTKVDVLLALLLRSIDVQFERLSAATELAPIERVFALGERAVLAYTEDGSLYRPLLRGLSETSFDGPLPNVMEHATGLWREALRDAEAEGLVDPELDLDAFARLLHYQYRVTMFNWAMGEIGAREWFAELAYALAMLLRGAVTDAQRPKLHRRLRAAQRQLESARPGADTDASAATLTVGRSR